MTTASDYNFIPFSTALGRALEAAAQAMESEIPACALSQGPSCDDPRSLSHREGTCMQGTPSPPAERDRLFDNISHREEHEPLRRRRA